MLIDLHEAPQDRKTAPGTWRRLLAHTPEPECRPYWTAIVTCPECARPLLASLHTISEDGQISPSLGHPMNYPNCSWHTRPRLIGWNPLPPLPPTPNIETCAKCGKQAHQIGGWGTWTGPGIICIECRSTDAGD